MTTEYTLHVKRDQAYDEAGLFAVPDCLDTETAVAFAARWRVFALIPGSPTALRSVGRRSWTSMRSWGCPTRATSTSTRHGRLLVWGLPSRTMRASSVGVVNGCGSRSGSTRATVSRWPSI